MILIRKFNEAFEKGTSYLVIQKVANVLSRKIGKAIYVSSYPEDIITSNGNFIAYTSILGNKEKLRWNFDVSGRSDKIVSISYFKNVYDDKPVYVIEFEGENIVQIIDDVADVLTGNFEESYRKHERASFASDLFLRWLDSDKRKNIDLIQNERLSAVFENYFMRWIYDNHEKEMSRGAFMKEAKDYLDSKGLRNRYARSVSVKKGSKEVTVTNKALQKEFEALISGVSLEDKFQMIDYYIRMLLNTDSKKLLIIVGDPGIGKTKTVRDSLLANKGSWKVAGGSGAVKNAEALHITMFQHKDDVLLLDDVDSLLRGSNKDIISMLKALGDPGKSEITFISPKFTDRTSTPRTFYFKGRMIIISNLPANKIDSAIRSRAFFVEITMTEEEKIERIKQNLTNFLIDVAMQIKEEVLELLAKFGQFLNIDFRGFETAIRIRMSNAPNWQALVLDTLKK